MTTVEELIPLARNEIRRLFTSLHTPNRPPDSGRIGPDGPADTTPDPAPATTARQAAAIT
jgi:hypothetical protein